MTMICDNCGKTGIRWMGPLTNLTHTKCPHCGGINCQRVDPVAEVCEICGDPADDYSLDGEWLCDQCMADSDRHHDDFDKINQQL